MGCVEAAGFTILLNGCGDGFFRPECGLRQRCALSPYIFILGMDVLSRGLQFMVDTKLVKGVKLAPTVRPLTNCLYADYLLILGAATNQEATQILVFLMNFMYVSAQQIGPEKSHIWFSSATEPQVRILITQIFRMENSSTTQTYLGAPVADGRASFDFIIERFFNQLNSWKGKLLSQAGRVVLIKSTLQSLHVYYMATTRLPTKVLHALTDLMRRFFWSKKEEGRYLAYVSWERITKPKMEGGLGIRDLAIMGKSLMAKYLWQIAAGEETLWVNIVRAKYLPQSLLFHSKWDYRCLRFWKAIMSLREKLQPLLTW